MMSSICLPWYLERGDGPLLAAAVHDGSALRPDLIGLVALECERPSPGGRSVHGKLDGRFAHSIDRSAVAI